MTSEWNDERRRRRYRKRVHIPAVIETRNTTVKNAVDVQGNKEAEHWTGVQSGRVQILPGSLLVPSGEPWLFPPEPTEPPPLPTEIIRLVLVGDHKAGKSSVAREFAQANNSNHDEKERKMSSSQWSVDYYKKDLAFWQDEDDTVACGRIQLWDISGGGKSHMERKQELKHLIQKAAVVLLVASAEKGYQSLEKSVRRWKSWLDGLLPDSTVVLLINKCDLLPRQEGFKPSDWIQFGTKLGSLCQHLGIESCHLTSCFQSSGDPGNDATAETTGVEDAFMDEIRRLMKPTTLGDGQHSCKEPVAVVQAPASPVRALRTPVIEAKAVPISSPLR